MSDFKKSIDIRNRLLRAAKDFYEDLKTWDVTMHDDEFHTFEPLFKPNDSIIQIKVFYGTRDEGVLRGYHRLNKDAYERFLRELK